VCEGDLGHVIGILHAKDFLAASDNADVRALVKTPVVAPKSMPALKVLEQFRQTTVHIALAVGRVRKCAWLGERNGHSGSSRWRVAR